MILTDFEELLRLKKVRTLSGVSPVAVLTKPYPCPGKCLYCPTQESYPFQQYEATGHFPEGFAFLSESTLLD